MSEEIIGIVKTYFSKVGVAALEITHGKISLGDTLKFKGHTTQFEMTVGSMQKDNQAVNEAKIGDAIGIKVPERVRENDTVIKVTP
jgi:translation elongation factor EF-1alpha